MARHEVLYPIIWGGLICLLCCPATLLAQAPNNNDTLAPLGRARQAQRYFLTAKQYINEGRNAEAQHLLSQAVAAQHDLSEAYLLRAELKRDANDLAGAIVDYSVVIHQQPEHFEARFQRATTLYEAQRFEAARDDFQYLLAYPPGETNTIYFKGASPADAAPPGEFVASAATTLQSDMKADLLNYVGLCYLNTDDIDRADYYFKQAAAHHPEEPTAYVNLGLTHEASGDTLQAIGYYRQAIQKAPDHPTALRNLSSLARQLNDTTLEQEILSYETTSYDMLLQQGIYHQRKGDYETAIQIFDQAFAQAPYQTEVLIQRGFAYEKALRMPEALDDYSLAIRLDPQAEKAYSNRGNIYFRQENYEQALEDYNQALLLNPENVNAWYNRGITHHQLGNQEEACHDLQKALSLGSSAATKPLTKLCNSNK